jgi:hypothetical protein
MSTLKNKLPVALARVIETKNITRPNRRGFSSTVIAAVSAVTLIVGAESVLAAQVAEYSQAVTEDGSLIVYESSWCEVQVGMPVTVTLRDVLDPPADSPEGNPESVTAKVMAVYLKNYDKQGDKKFKNAVTSNGKVKNKQATVTPMSEVVPPAPIVMITLQTVTDADGAVVDDWYTVHLRLVLSDGSRLGVNLHSMPCEVTPDAT